MEAYFNVLYYTELVTILAEQVENAQSALTLASRQEELGVKGHADVVQMEADLADREYELVSARNSLADAKITLEDVMLWPVGEELVIDTSLDSLDATTSGASGNVIVEDIILKARASMPSVLVAKGALDNAKYAPALHAKAKLLDPSGGRILFAPVQALPMASSQLRARLAAGEECEAELPEEVRSVIRREGLYRNTGRG